MDNALRLLGLAKKAGRLEIGEEPVGAAARARKAKMLILACDAAANTVRRAAHFGEAGNVLFLISPYSKAQLGQAVGRASCAMLAFTDPGFAASFTEKLAAQDPERYSPAALSAGERAAKALERQRDQRRHEKNLERGKKKPWAPPPDKRAPGPRPAGKKRPADPGHGPKGPGRGGRPAGPKRRTPNS